MQLHTAPTASTVHARIPKKRTRKRRFSGAKPSLLFAFFKVFSKALCCFLMPLASWLSIPSPFAVAWLAAIEPKGVHTLYAVMGLAASLIFRALWRIELDLWQYVGALIMLAAIQLWRKPHAMQGAIVAALCMVPRLIAVIVSEGLAYSTFLAFAAVPIAYGATLMIRQGVAALKRGGALPGFKEQAGLMLIVLLLISSLGYLRILSFNLGHIAAVLATLVAAKAASLSGGAICGMLCALALALSGHPVGIAVFLCASGLTAGLHLFKRHRIAYPAFFLCGYFIIAYLSTSPEPYLSLKSSLIGGFLFLFVPESLIDRIRGLLHSAIPVKRGMENAYVQSQLEKWETALYNMAQALPPSEAQNQEELLDTANQALCAGCDQISCTKKDAIQRELIACVTDRPEQREKRLDKLLQYGCERQSLLQNAAHTLSQQNLGKSSALRKAWQEREMTKTHILALAQTISRTRELTRGETLSDLQAVYRVKQVIRELNLPAELCYARRVEGHLHLALKADGLTLSSKHPQRLIEKLDKEDKLRLSITRYERGRVELEETPLYTADLGVASIPAGDADPGLCGDSITIRNRSGGQLLVALSDGMGHGRKAQLESEKTLELLMLCMEAGYTRRQAIAAVNGMMLSSSIEERFATVDLFDLNLWTGETINEKLGAAPSYIVRGNYLKRVDGSSLPLGILQEIAPTTQRFHLHSGDILIIMSDGVSDAFDTHEELEKAILASLYIQPQRMADTLLRSALLASTGEPKDDMTVMILLLYDQNRSTSE